MDREWARVVEASESTRKNEESFVHLHTHTEYSMLDGAARIGDLVQAAVADGQPALAITDHGNMYGVLDFYKECRERGITPIIGTEAYMAAQSRLERPVRRGRIDDTGGEGDKGEKLYYHLTVLAETTQGYRNLIKLSSAAYLEGYYYKPRVDWELLERHHEGLIATTGCLGGVVAQALLAEDFDSALSLAGRLQDIFGKENLFVELQDHGIGAQKTTNPSLIRIARALDAPLLATNDSHYCRREDAVAHDALLCVQTGATIHDPKRFKFEGEEHYLKSARGDAPAVRGGARCLRQHPLGRREGNRRARARQAGVAPVPCAGSLPEAELRGVSRQLPRPSDLRGRRGPLRLTDTARGGRPARFRAEGHFRDGFRGLLPRRVGHHPLREGGRHQGWAGPRVSSRVLRGLLPAHRRPRPDPLRPAFRALLEPGPKANARHRHGLRRAAPGRDDPLRRGALRSRSRRSDRHVLDDKGPGGSSRWRPGPGPSLCPRRPDRQGNATARNGP